MFGFFSTSQLAPTDAARLSRVEAKLDLILQHLGIAPADAVAERLSAEVRTLADGGDKIKAIKAYRDQTGAGLKDAKEAVEAYLLRQ